LVPDELWMFIDPLLPSEPPKPNGGRPRVPDRAALAGIIYVLKSGIPWGMLPKELGFGSGVTCWRRLRDWQKAGVWHRLHRVLLNVGYAAGPKSSTPIKPTIARAADRFLRKRDIKARIARRGIESSERLGRHRWVVERTLAWISRCRRLCVRYERRADIHLAFLLLCCSLICLGYLRPVF
jgi:transposase